MTSSVQKPMTLFCGPCVIEDEGLVLEIAQELKRQLGDLMMARQIELYFKASYDKANRTSKDSFRGPGREQGLKILSRVKSQTGLPVLTDFHTPEEADRVAEVVDCLQVPAFLCRQTDMIEAGARAALQHGHRLNIKKGQFLAPWDARHIVTKAREVEKESARAGKADWLTLTERGVSFGYQTLVVDMISFQVVRSFGVPAIYDATHSIQSPGGGPGGKSSGGKREYLESLARAAMAAGADGVFMECHPRPSEAKSDGPNAFYLEHVGAFVRQLLAIRQTVSGMPYLLPEAKK